MNAAAYTIPAANRAAFNADARRARRDAAAVERCLSTAAEYDAAGRPETAAEWRAMAAQWAAGAVSRARLAFALYVPESDAAASVAAQNAAALAARATAAAE